MEYKPNICMVPNCGKPAIGSIRTWGKWELSDTIISVCEEHFK